MPPPSELTLLETCAQLHPADVRRVVVVPDGDDEAALTSGERPADGFEYRRGRSRHLPVRTRQTQGSVGAHVTCRQDAIDERTGLACTSGHYDIRPPTFPITEADVVHERIHARRLDVRVLGEVPHGVEPLGRVGLDAQERCVEFSGIDDDAQSGEMGDDLIPMGGASAVEGILPMSARRSVGLGEPVGSDPVRSTVRSQHRHRT